MQADIERFEKNIRNCLIRHKPTVQLTAPLTPIITTFPFEMVSTNFLHPERSKGGYEYILAVVGHFTHFAQAYPTRNKSSKTAANKLYPGYILRFSFPKTIHHDQGHKFENTLFTKLQKLCNNQHSRTTPYSNKRSVFFPSCCNYFLRYYTITYNVITFSLLSFSVKQLKSKFLKQKEAIKRNINI